MDQAEADNVELVQSLLHKVIWSGSNSRSRGGDKLNESHLGIVKDIYLILKSSDGNSIDQLN